MFWCNFIIPDINKNKDITVTNSRASTRRTKKEHLKSLQEYHGFNVSNIKALSNCVHPELGLHILEASKAKALF